MVDDQSFFLRVGAGMTVLAALALWEWRRHRLLTRAREYAFLFGVTALTVGYALVHDAVTFQLSPEYFFILKAVDGDAFFPGVVRIAAQAGWTAGLFIGLGLLVANNPGSRRQLRYRELASMVRFPLGWSIAAALGGGLYGAQASAAPLVGYGLHEPAQAMLVWGVHIGSYVGALIGLVHAMVRVRRRRVGRTETRRAEGVEFLDPARHA